MTSRLGAARVLVLAGLGLGLWLSAAVAEASGPACVELTLPELLPMRESWHSLLRQETRPLVTEQGTECARIEVLLVSATHEPLLLISWAGETRTAPLAMAELSEAERPRAAALLARGVLQQLVEQHENEVASEPPDAAAAAVPVATALPAWDERAASANTMPDSAAQLTPPRPPPSAPKKTSWDDLRWEPATNAQSDRFQDPAHTRSLWSGTALSGTALALTSLTAMFELELGLQRSLPQGKTRLGLGLVGILAPGVGVSGPGLRANVEFRTAHNRRSRLWLGPGLSFAELIISTYNESDLSRSRSFHTVATADVRATLDLALSRRIYLTLALELAYALRYLRVVQDGQLLFAYAGPLMALRVGIGF